jgi:UDP-N-acetylmuramoylalanine--D-glutamate ligase
MAAVALALRLGISPKIIRAAVVNFKGVAHRLELVGKKGHKFAYNDSAATTPESAIAGIDSFLWEAEANDIYLIAGGSSKKLDMSILADKISQTPEIKKVVLLKGQASDELLELIKEKGQEDKILTVVDDMAKAVLLLSEEINQQVKKGIENNYEKRIEIVKNDIMLLSPGCASFGLFDNEFDRGRQFREEARKVFKIK